MISCLLLLFNIFYLNLTGYSNHVVAQQTHFVSENDYAFITKKAPNLNSVVVDKALIALECAKKNEVLDNGIFAIIDFSLPSNKKRMWIFDLKNQKLLFYTYVSHGIKSGITETSYFSNQDNSKASSIGLFQAEKSYHGRHGYSLKLTGLDKKFNDNAYSRFIVLHGSWYTKDDFIKKYGRAGRSWGCPSIPSYLVKPVIDVLKDGALIFAYYPMTAWMQRSEYLNCNGYQVGAFILDSPKPIVENREPALFADLNKNNKHDIDEPVVAITADKYQIFFHVKAPVDRMLRRQINNMEYIVLTQNELRSIVSQGVIDDVYLIKPEVKRVRGYYATEMKIVDFGKKRGISKDNVVFYQEGKVIQLVPTKHFIRWLGL